MRLRDRLWLWQNKKPQRPVWSYIRIVFLWTLYGVLIGWGMILVGAIPERWYIGVVLILFSIIVLLWLHWTDRKNGYVDALHQRWLQRWNERKERIEGER